MMNMVNLNLIFFYPIAKSEMKLSKLTLCSSVSLAVISRMSMTIFVYKVNKVLH